MDNRSSSSVCGGEHRRPELRVILLGGRGSGKSSAGNGILGKDEFPAGGRTGVCVRRRGEVGAWRVVVVDTPGWWCDVRARDTPELVKREMARGGGASLCAPGPHAFLLAVKASSPFTEKRRRAAEEHVALFGEGAWERTLVLFTWGDWLGNTTVHQHIEKGGKALRWLVGKCGNRCHVLSNKSPATVAQVTELLAKVNEMVAGKGGRHYEMDGKALREEEERRKEMKGRAKQRLEEVWKQRSLLTGSVRRLSKLRILLLGARQSGKSSAGNRILGRAAFPVGVRTAVCAAGRGQAAGGRRAVTVIDTPGWWMNYFAAETPEFDKREVRRSAGLLGRPPGGPHAVLVAVRADRSFGETHRRALAEHVELLGATVWRHALVLFTFGDWLADGTAEEHVEAEGGGALRWLVEKCGNRYHVLDDANRGGGDAAQVARLLERIEEMVAGNGGSHYEPSQALQEEEERSKAAEERAKERMSKVQEERRAIRSLFPGGVPSLSDLTIVLLGSASVGKSSAGNTILGTEAFEAGQKTDLWQTRQVTACGRMVTVVDTPGWRTGRSDDAVGGGERENPGGPSLCSLRPNALLLVVNASSSFTETHRRAAEEGLEALGVEEAWWDRALVLFTNGDWLGGTSTVERRVETEGEGALRWLVEKCGNRYHVLDNRSHGERSQVSELLEKIDEMEAVWERRREEERKTELHEREHEEELDRDALVPVHGFSSHRCVTKRGDAFEIQDSFKFQILPLLSLVLQSGGRAGKIEGGSIAPGWERAGSLAHRSGAPLPIERNASDGESTIEELESFIDAYFETAESPVSAETRHGDGGRSLQLAYGRPPTRDEGGQTEPDYRSLSLTDQKLSNLDILDEMQERLTDMDRTLQLSRQVIQELRKNCKEEHSPLKPIDAEEPGESENS